MADMDVDAPAPAPADAPAPTSTAVAKGKAKGGDMGKDGKKRFEVKKVRLRLGDTRLSIDDRLIGSAFVPTLCDMQWNAVALWAWGMFLAFMLVHAL